MSIVAATDLSENSKGALKYAASLAEVLGEALIIVHVVELWGRDMSRIVEAFDDTTVEPSEEAIDNVNAFATETLGFDHARCEVLVGHPPVERILAFAAKERASVVVAGTSGQSKLTEAFFGSTISALVRQSEIPVLAVPPGADHVDFDAILAPVDFSDCSDRSLSLASKLAAGFDAELFVLHAAPFNVPTVAPPIAYVPQSASEVRKASKSRVESMLIEHDLVGKAKILTDLGAPHTAIEAAIDKHDIHLVVMGTHGRRGIAKFFLGSTAERLLRSRACPVLVLRDVVGD